MIHISKKKGFFIMDVNTHNFDKLDPMPERDHLLTRPRTLPISELTQRWRVIKAKFAVPKVVTFLLFTAHEKADESDSDCPD